MIIGDQVVTGKRQPKSVTVYNEMRYINLRFTYLLTYPILTRSLCDKLFIPNNLFVVK